MPLGGKLKIPKKVKIRNTIFRVEIDPEFTRRNPNALGQTFLAGGVIKIDGILSKQMQEVTFLHEIIHAICFHSALGPLFTPQQHEAISHELSESLYQVIKENDLFKE